jgi:preprotein translocase subunit YajC
MLEAISELLIPSAWAMAPGGEGGAGGLAGFLQQKKQKDHQAMIGSLKKGDKVVTTGGIYGLIEQVGEKTITLKISENVKVKFGKGYVASVRSTADED